MSGIVGIIKPEGIPFTDLQKMAATINHRGKSKETTCISLNGSISYFEDPLINDFSDARAIIGVKQLSDNERNKIFHSNYIAAKNLIVLADSQLYNYSELRKKIETKGYQFRTDSENELIAYYYHEYGINFTEFLNGAWAIVIIDPDKRKIYFSRDRFGIKPLYIYSKSGITAFSSEIKAFHGLQKLNFNLSQSDLIRHFQSGKLENENRTLLENIEQLAPSTTTELDYLSFQLAGNKYYTIEDQLSNISPENTPESFIHDYKESLIRALDLRLINRVNTGATLSGGMDSSSLAYIMSNYCKVPLITITAYYNEADYNELPYATKVLSTLQDVQPISIIPDSADLWKNIDRIAWQQDLPFESTSIMVQWQLMKIAQENHINTLISGTGADGPLGGFKLSAGYYLLTLLARCKFAKLTKESINLKFNRKINPYHELSRAFFNSLPKKYHSLLRRNIKMMPHLIREDYNTVFPHEEKNSLKIVSFNDYCIRGIRGGLQKLLRYEDRNSATFGINAITPFLDHTLVEKTLSLPIEWRFRDGFSKYILRKSFENELPDEIIWRKSKIGFATPQKYWVKQLSSDLISFINQTTMPDALDKEKVKKFCLSCIEDNTNNQELWKTIIFLKWYSVYF